MYGKTFIKTKDNIKKKYLNILYLFLLSLKSLICSNFNILMYKAMFVRSVIES